MAAETASASLVAADSGDLYGQPHGDESGPHDPSAAASRKYSSSSVEGIGLSHPALGPGPHNHIHHQPRRSSGGNVNNSNSLDGDCCGGHQMRSSSKQSSKQLLLQQQHHQLSVPETKKASRNRPASLSPFRFKSKDSSRRSSGDANDAEDERLLGSKQSINSSSEQGTVECSTPGSAGSSSSSTSTSSSIFSWRKKQPRRSNSSSMFSSMSRSAASPSSPTGGPAAASGLRGTGSVQPPVSTGRNHQSSGHSSRRGSQPVGFSLPQLVRRSLQPLISSSPSTDADETHSDSVSKLRYIKCKQVKTN